MADSPTITIAAPPTTAEIASQELSLMAALSGVLTDYNPGSQIRTMAESQGAVIEQQGIQTQALAYQALVFSALSLFGIFAGQPTAATTIVDFSTASSGTPPPASQNVTIPAGTFVQTNGGVQFKTTTAVTLSAGTNSISVPVSAVIAGAAGNVPANSITAIVSGLTYPLFVTNPTAATGGANAPSLSASLAEFSAVVASIGLSSPVAIANAAQGVSYGSETVAYATCFEPWLEAGSGAGSGQAGWQLFIDNGNGTASSGLIAAVGAKLTGGTVSGASNASGAIGYRDAGVPYGIYAVTPTWAYVSVSGTLVSSANVALVSGALVSAVNAYFTLPFGTKAEQAQIAAAVSNTASLQFSSLAITLSNSISGSPLAIITPPPSGRVLLANLAMDLSQ
jgi:uncharacterized phage protein gp47/JayE